MTDIQELSVDILNNRVLDYAFATQYDEGRVIKWYVTRNGQPIDLTNMAVYVVIRKTDNTVIYDSCDKVDNAAILTLDSNMTAAIGKNKYQLQVINGDEVIGTVDGVLKVTSNILDRDKVVSQDSFDALNDTLKRANDDYAYVIDLCNGFKEDAENAAAASAESAADSATSAALSGDMATLSESYAHGGTTTRAGEDTDNALYYSNLAARYSRLFANEVVSEIPPVQKNGDFWLLPY